jgi:HK97 gp10 family phage protein
MSRKYYVRAVRAAGKPTEERQRQTAPDDPTTPGSQVRENIGTNVTDQTASGVIGFTGLTKKGFPGGFAELGTRHQKQTPFIAPSFDEAEAIAIISEVLGEGLEKELKKL